MSDFKEEEQFNLNDLLHLDFDSKEVRNNWKITLSVNNNPSPIDQWLSRDEDNGKDGLDFSFYPYQVDKNGKKEVILKDGNYVVVAVKLPKGNLWLLVSVCHVTKVHYDDNNIKGHPFAEHEVVEKYKKYFGRVIFSVENKKARGYNFWLRTYIDRCLIHTVLAKPYDGDDFVGYDNVVNIPFKDLNNYLFGKHYGSQWYRELSKYYGVYCLRNRQDNKVYVGCAYGEGGLAQRLDCYMQTLDGGNEELVALHEKLIKEKGKEEADQYFYDNFVYSILELIPKTATQNDVIAREDHWKDIFQTKNPDISYNKN